MKFDWLYFEPFFYGVLVYLDHAKILNDSQTVCFYVAFGAWITAKYLIFMQSTVIQISSYLNISFLKVKQVKETKKRK